jgi:predicted HTH transcriptional regulator
MKPPSEWDESDLLRLIEIGAEETLSVDWKEAGALSKSDGPKNEIAKDVSAFANSDGGYVVYGIREDDQPPHKAAELSPIDPKQFSPEWLENIITSRIKPPIQNLRIQPVNLSGLCCRRAEKCNGASSV